MRSSTVSSPRSTSNVLCSGICLECLLQRVGLWSTVTSKHYWNTVAGCTFCILHSCYLGPQAEVYSSCILESYIQQCLGALRLRRFRFLFLGCCRGFLAVLTREMLTSSHGSTMLRHSLTLDMGYQNAFIWEWTLRGTTLSFRGTVLTTQNPSSRSLTGVV